MCVVYEFLKLLSHSKHSFMYPIRLYVNTHTLTQTHSLTHMYTHTHTHTYTHTLTHAHRGGIELIFNGTNLDVVQRPMLVFDDTEYVNAPNVSQF